MEREVGSCYANVALIWLTSRLPYISQRSRSRDASLPTTHSFDGVEGDSTVMYHKKNS